MPKSTEPRNVDAESFDAVADRVSEFDFDRANAMLDIMAKATNIGPRATSIFGLAQAELERLNTEAKQISLDRAEAAKSIQHDIDRANAQAAAERRAAEEVKAAEAKEAEDAKARKPQVLPNPDASRTATIAEAKTRRL